MRDIVVTIVAFGVVPFCLFRAWIGILAWNWMGLMNPHRLTWGFAQGLPFAQTIALATLLGIATSKDRRPIPWCPELVLVLLMLVHFGITSLVAWVPEIAWNRWVDFSKVVLMTYCATMMIYGKNRIRWLVIVIAVSVGFFGVKGGIWTIATGGGERVQGPKQSFLSGNTFIGLGLCMVIPLLVVIAREETNKWIKRGFNAAVVLNILAAIFTYSRGAMLGLAAILPLLFLNAKRRFIVILLAIPIVIGGLMWAPEKIFERAETTADYKTDESANMRLQSWTVAINIASESPFTGAGFNFEYFPGSGRWLAYTSPHLMPMQKTSVAHSIYFQVLGQHGFMGLALFLALLIVMLKSLRRLTQETRGNEEMEWLGNYAAAIRIALIGYMVAGAFLSSAYFDLVYLYASLTAILRRELADYQARVKAAAPGPGRRSGTPAPGAAGGARQPAPGAAGGARPQPAGARGPAPAAGRAFRYGGPGLKRDGLDPPAPLPNGARNLKRPP